MTIRGKPDVSAFLDGGADLKPTKKKIVEKEERQKVASLPVKILIDLKRRSIDESEQCGNRVTESDIIKRALENYLYK